MMAPVSARCWYPKGCSLGCRWVQNPESRARTQDLLYDARLCLEGCELCAKAAPEVIGAR